MKNSIIDFIHDFDFSAAPEHARHWAELCVLDLTGVGLGGATLPLSRIIRNHAHRQFGSPETPVAMLFDGRPCSPAGAALAGGMTIDALDGHDGFNEAKGHIGCGVFPAAMALAQDQNLVDGQEFLTQIILGYELGARLALALHGTVTDYHTSGAWVAIACGAIGARQLGLGQEATRHALGIAEYHGPRSQMMRTIDHPSMVKDGSGWGAMAGVSAAYLARDGFTGAPAITVEGDDVAHFWKDLGQCWLITEQYFKPYPVCRWAQGPIEAVLALKMQHNLASDDVDHIEIVTFHESCRLATNEPQNTEEAQYSTSYPCAVAMVKGTVGIGEVQAETLRDTEVLRLSKSLLMREDDYCNDYFPGQRYAKAILHLKTGRQVESDWMNPIWTAQHPPSEAELRQKYHGLADPLIGAERAGNVESSLAKLSSGGDFREFSQQICRAN